uniref:Alba domain-containing protein n=1 Tax=Strongyloides papillosus TaxID=174720 RepID=A0A0N5C1N8_STREA
MEVDESITFEAVSSEYSDKNKIDISSLSPLFDKLIESIDDNERENLKVYNEAVEKMNTLLDENKKKVVKVYLEAKSKNESPANTIKELNTEIELTSYHTQFHNLVYNVKKQFYGQLKNHFVSIATEIKNNKTPTNLHFNFGPQIKNVDSKTSSEINIINPRKTKITSNTNIFDNKKICRTQFKKSGCSTIINLFDQNKFDYIVFITFQSCYLKEEFMGCFVLCNQVSLKVGCTFESKEYSQQLENYENCDNDYFDSYDNDVSNENLVDSLSELYLGKLVRVLNEIKDPSTSTKKPKIIVLGLRNNDINLVGRIISKKIQSSCLSPNLKILASTLFSLLNFKFSIRYSNSTSKYLERIVFRESFNSSDKIKNKDNYRIIELQYEEFLNNSSEDESI